MKSKFFIIAAVIAIGVLFGASALAKNADSVDSEVITSGYNPAASIYTTIDISADKDSDCIPNVSDACPDKQGIANTDPARNGCPPSQLGDYDDDGVMDIFDHDDDGDGVEERDGDQCLYTAPGTEVDEHGCPINGCVTMQVNVAPQPVVAWTTQDSDEDGVANGSDACADTPAGVDVNPAGCPDTDGDGLFDNEDACVDEAADTENGCAVIDSENLHVSGATIPLVDGATDTTTDENPSLQAGSGGCSMVDAMQGSSGNVISVIVFAMSLVPMVVRRRTK